MNTREFIRSIRQTKLTIVFAGALTLPLAGAAIAQEGQSTSQPARPNSPAQAASPTAGASPNSPAQADGGAERIVITANKREEDAQVVPSSVSVVDGVQLDNLHATQLTDFAPYVPGFTVNSSGTPGQATIALRGLAPISGGSTVGTYINEVPTGSSGIYQRASAFQLDLLPYDIRRVEVLRGPQGTLYGANSIGGLLKYVTIDPSLTTREFHVGGGVSGVENSGDPGYDAHITADVPLITDHLGIRVSYARNELPGFIDNVVNGATDINATTQQSALVALLWQPYTSVSFRFTALGQRIDSDNNAFIALDPKTERPLHGYFTNQVFVNEPFKKTIGQLIGTLNVDLRWADFTSASGYSNTKTEQRIDSTFPFGQAPLLFGSTTTGISAFDLGLNLDKFSQELRLTSKPEGRFLWQTGFFFTYERSLNTQFVSLSQQNGAPFTGPLAALSTLTSVAQPSKYYEYAGFANASYHFTDQLSLGAGLRYSHNDQDYAENVAAGVLLPLGNTPGTSGESVVDFLVTPQFQIDKDKQIYVRIATGYEPGGPNVALAGVPPQVDATRATSYEVGLKSEFANRRLLLNITGFHIDLSNIQVGTLVNNVSALVNGGDATSNGVEFTAEFQPVQGLHFGVNGAYTHATLSNDVPSLNGRDGDRLPYIPEFSGSATADYLFPLRGLRGDWNGHVGAGYRFVGSSYNAVESSPTAYHQGHYGALDLTADVSNRNWTIRAFARNVTGERAFQTVIPTTNLNGSVNYLRGVPIQPRTVGFEVDFKF